MESKVDMPKGLGAEISETLGYPSQVPINVRIWMSQGCSNLEVLSTFGLILRYTAQHELETIRLLVVEIHMKVVITSFLLQPHSSLILNSHASPSNSLFCCSQVTKKDY